MKNNMANIKSKTWEITNHDIKQTILYACTIIIIYTAQNLSWIEQFLVDMWVDKWVIALIVAILWIITKKYLQNKPN